jgi:hypothetical protein
MGGVGILSNTVAVGVPTGNRVAVGSRVLVGDGTSGVGVSRLAVGRKLGKVGVEVGKEVEVTVGVAVGKKRSAGATRSTTMAAKANRARPPITPMMIPSVRVTPSPG